MAFDYPIVIILFGLLLVLLLGAIAYFLTRVVKVAWGSKPAASQTSPVPSQTSGSQVAGDLKFCDKVRDQNSEVGRFLFCMRKQAKLEGFSKSHDVSWSIFEINMLKKDSMPAFVTEVGVTLVIAVPVLYYLLSAPLMDIAIDSALVTFVWFSALRMSRHHKNGISTQN